MKITKLQLENYKNFSAVNINFDSFTVIVGANAAGKSNLISAFRFIKNIMILGIDNIIALEGGIKNIINSQCEKGAPVVISFQIDFPDNIGVLKDQSEKIDLTIKSLDYYFSIVPHKKGPGYRINHDKIANYA
jgi:predicted ATPase